MNSLIENAILNTSVGWITLALLSVLWISLGWLWGQNAKDLGEYTLAGRKVGLASGIALPWPSGSLVIPL